MRILPLRAAILLGCGAIMAMAVLLPFGRSAAAAAELNALVWCDHSDPNLLKPFEEANGVKVNLKEFEGTGAGWTRRTCGARSGGNVRSGGSTCSDGSSRSR